MKNDLVIYKTKTSGEITLPRAQLDGVYSIFQNLDQCIRPMRAGLFGICPSDKNGLRLFLKENLDDVCSTLKLASRAQVIAWSSGHLKDELSLLYQGKPSNTIDVLSEDLYYFSLGDSLARIPERYDQLSPDMTGLRDYFHDMFAIRGVIVSYNKHDNSLNGGDVGRLFNSLKNKRRSNIRDIERLVHKYVLY